MEGYEPKFITLKAFIICEIVLFVLVLMWSIILIIKANNIQDICKYNHCQIVEKNDPPMGHYFKIRVNNKITNRIFVTDYDWVKYDVGDFIDCK